MVSNDELACVYSALILQDDEIAITVTIALLLVIQLMNSICILFFPALFAKALEGVDLRQLISNVGSGVSGGGGAVGVTTGGSAGAGEAAAAAEEPKKEEKKEESEESDEDMGFGLFD
nr:60S acidic ribosomal protein P1 [Parasteatoda tepidariorum]